MNDTNPKPSTRSVDQPPATGQHTPILRDNETLYVLGADGTNDWWMGVQASWHDRLWRIEKAKEIHAALNEREFLRARVEAQAKRIADLEAGLTEFAADHTHAAMGGLIHCARPGKNDVPCWVVERARALLSPRPESGSDGEGR
jgi:hypothetical protein